MEVAAYSLPTQMNPQSTISSRLPRLAEKMSMNEQVVCREKDAEIRMRVVPAEDYFVRELFIDVAS